MKCAACGTELRGAHMLDTLDEACDGYPEHTELRCALARVAALESKLAECERERDEKAAAAEDGWSRFNHAADIYRATAAKLAKAREAIGQMVFELERDEDDLVDVNEVADHVANLGRRALASLDVPEAAEKRENGK